MKHRLSTLKISQRLLCISFAYTLPIAVMLFFIVRGINTNIHFAQLELLGNQYQRPLEGLLRALSDHEMLALRSLRGDADASRSLSAAKSEVERLLVELGATDSAIGAALQFTPESLAKRKRQHACLATFRQEWEGLKNRGSQLTADQCVEQHAHLVADLRTMISHAGDMSNLILDPDLDSYYLMDATLCALPQTQERLAQISAQAETVLRQPSLSRSVLTGLAVQSALLQQSDVDRVTGDADTSLNEDENFYGRSASLQANLPPAVKQYADAQQSLVALLGKIAEGATNGPVLPTELAAVSEQARTASFSLWQTGVQELDILLKTRIRSYEHSRMSAVAWSMLAWGLALVVAQLVARSINRPLHEVWETLTATSAQISREAGQVSSASRSLSEGASEQAASLEETSASLEEIASMTKRSAENARVATELARQTRATAETGAGEMQSMNTAVDEIKTASDNISRIIKTIDEIAFQTNILALNAAVEAARAGEAGFGFAVVADEVRNLAQRAAQAARETGEMIDDSVQKSRRGAELSVKISGRFQEILSKTRRVDELVAQIALAAREQSQGIEQVTVAVSQIDKVTQATVASAEESAAMSEELNAQAQNLRQVVGDLTALVNERPADVELTASAISVLEVRPQVRNFPASQKMVRFPSPAVIPLPAPVAEKHVIQSPGPVLVEPAAASTASSKSTLPGENEDFLEWDDESMSSGEESVDDQHKSLIANLNKLDRAHRAGAGREEVKKMVEFLGTYAVAHFKHEEGLMENRQCPTRQKNKEAHAQFLKQFEELSARFATETNTDKMVAHIKSVVSKWLVNHICRVDSGLRNCARSCPSKSLTPIR